MLMLLLWKLMHLGKVLLKATLTLEFAVSRPPIYLQDNKSPLLCTFQNVQTSVFLHKDIFIFLVF